MATPIDNFFVVLSKIGDIEIDAVLSEEHHFDTHITQNPVEDGTIFSDNSVLLPVILEIEGRISDASLTSFFPSVKGHSIDQYKKLVALQISRETFSVSTGINTYENMMFESLSFPRIAEDGQSLRFNAVIRELQIVGNEAKTNRTRIDESVRHTALSSTNNGLVPTVPVL